MDDHVWAQGALRLMLLRVLRMAAAEWRRMADELLR